jgi:sulfoxide reductase heme-binding subunit YedZ
MSTSYRAVQWNAHKKTYDAVLVGAVAAFLIARVGLGLVTGEADPAVLLMRSLGLASIVLLHVILAIGPLARLDARFTPLLYNRRHLGVTMFVLGLLHSIVALGYYGGFGVLNPVNAVIVPTSGPTGSWAGAIPFELFGFVALLILFVMAATSHDFWLANLGARFWKWLHMLVYGAYVLLIAHVAFGAVQDRLAVGGVAGYALPLLLGLGAVGLGGLHLASALRSRCDPTVDEGISADGWVDVASVDDIEDDHAITVCLKDRGGPDGRVAVFKHGGTVSAVTNMCKHQGGPLGEGKVIDGCITCPWHGYQYEWGKGQSPPPYSETIATYEVRIEGDRVLLNPEPKAPGTVVEPAQIAGGAQSEKEASDV